mmetsp:Transcript_62098/g.134797  ORF Transcript_62098/g.134797 Transcript_62098/m.134797 type:complete len:486 (-) Transcript_62098:86-1543(-)
MAQTQKGPAGIDPEVRKQDSLLVLSSAARERRRSYISSKTEDLRQLCEKRKLDLKETHASRRDLIKTLEDDDDGRKVFVKGNVFEAFYLTIIFLNALAIGFQIDNPDALKVGDWLLLNFTFFSLFVAEIIIKVAALGWSQYAADPWHQFDLVVTFLVAMQMASTYSLLEKSVYDTWNQYIAGDFIQILRLCRLFRLARFFKELGMLIESFFRSIKALFWIGVLLLIWFYLAACVATVFIGKRERWPLEDKAEIEELRHRFSSIPLSMFALFEVMTLEGWTDYVRPLLHTRVHIVFFFIAFIFITAFFMLNLITAVVVDRTVAAQEAADEGVTKEHQLQRVARIDLIITLLQSENSNPTNEDVISLSDFDDAIQQSETQEVLTELGWTKAYMDSMFAMVDHEGSKMGSLSALRKLLVISDEPLDTANYVRFQMNLAQKLDYQEKLMLTVLNALEVAMDTELELPESLQGVMKRNSLLKSPPHHASK